MHRYLAAFCLFLAAIPPAFADCAADFRDVNRLKQAAGPYELDSKALIRFTAVAATKEIGTEMQVVLPNSLRIKTHNTSAPTEVIIAAGKGWVHSDAGWKPIEAQNVADALARVTENGFVYSKSLANLQCLGERDFEGSKALAFQYDTETNGYPTKMMAYFDPSTRLPVGAESATDLESSTVRATMHYKFDPSIRIEAPVP